MAEPLNGSPRFTIVRDDTPLPPWAGIRFTCGYCPPEYQLEAADVCTPIDGTGTGHLTPTCIDCGHATVIDLSRADVDVERTARLLAIALLPEGIDEDEDETPGLAS